MVTSRLTDSRGVAGMLSCSERHVRNLDHTGQMPRPVRIGILKKWAVAELDAWIAAGCPDRQTWERLKMQQPQAAATA